MNKMICRQMQIKAIFMWLILVILTSCSSFEDNQSQVVDSQSLNGDWQLQLINTNETPPLTYTVSVPNNWINEGIDHDGDAIYSRQFNYPIDNVSRYPISTIPANLHLNNPNRFWLDFDAVDYAASINLNQRDIGSHNGYFSPFSFDITDAISPGTNKLSVTVSSPNETLAEDWSLNKTLIKGVLNHHDTRPGGAWSERGQDRNSGGIWGGVKLRTTGTVAINHIKVKPLVSDVEQQQTSGRIAITLDSNYQGSVKLDFTLKRNASESDSYLFNLFRQTEKYQLITEVSLGEQVIDWQLPQAQRALWWPWDWGSPNLYELTVAVLVENTMSDTRHQNIGFRKVKFDEEAGVFYMNDKPYFIRGTNYIASQWLGGISAQDYANDIALMRQANINSIRIHAHVAGKSFYQQADKLGMVVWQDFPLQWGYSDSAEFISEAVEQANDMTDMLYNHPSIAFWCGQNEPPWDATWMKYKYPSYNPDKNKSLTEAVYQQLLTANDGRVVRKASYTAEHPWLGWYSGHYMDYSEKPNTAIISEFGAQAMPNYSNVIEMLNEEPKWPLSTKIIEQLSYHNYQPRETLQIAKVDEGESLSQFVMNSQEYQRLVTKYAIEQLRLNKGQGLAAIYQFMFNDSWNAVTWSVLDVSRSKKPGYYAMQQSYQPLVAVLQRDNEIQDAQISVTLINDSLVDYQNLKMTVRDDKTGAVWVMSHLNIDANQQRLILNKQILSGLSNAVSVILYDQLDREISRNTYLPQDR